MQQSDLTFGPFRLDGSKGTLLREGELLSVGQRGIRLMEALLQRPGEVVTKAELMDAAWPDMAIEESNLSVQIAQLRKALGPATDGGEWIETIPRIGYRIVPAKNGAGEGAPTDAAPATTWHAFTRPGPLRWAAALVAAALVAAVAAFVFPRPAEVAAPVAASGDLSIAVLPFDDMAGKPELAYFGAGVAEDIIAMLARVPELTVAARNSSFRYRGQSVDVRQVGKELGVAYVLEGSVRKDADRVRIVAQLIDAKIGNHVWAERFDRTGTDPLALQDEVTGKIVATLAGYSGAIRRAAYREAWGRDGTSLQEYDYYLRAMDVHIRFTPDASEQGLAIWREASDKFPDSSLLKMLGALLHMSRHIYGWSDDHEADVREAGRLAREALAQPNPTPLTRKGAHFVLAFVSLAEGNFDQALVEAEASRVLASHDGPFLAGLSEVPIALGQTSLALEWIDEAARGFAADDPWQVLVTGYRGWALAVGEEFELALATLSDPRLVALSQVGWRTVIPLLRAMTLAQMDRLEDAEAEIAKALEIDPTYSRAKFRNRNIHFDPAILERGLSALALAGLPEN
jgi:adenylate cyclase